MSLGAVLGFVRRTHALGRRPNACRRACRRACPPCRRGARRGHARPGPAGSGPTARCRRRDRRLHRGGRHTRRSLRLEAQGRDLNPVAVRCSLDVHVVTIGHRGIGINRVVCAVVCVMVCARSRRYSVSRWEHWSRSAQRDGDVGHLAVVKDDGGDGPGQPGNAAREHEAARSMCLGREADRARSFYAGLAVPEEHCAGEHPPRGAVDSAIAQTANGLDKDELIIRDGP